MQNTQLNMTPGPGNVLVLGPESYLTQRCKVRENTTSLVHVADLHSPITGTISAFVKAFPNRFSENGLINEIIGYLIAQEAGFPIAEEAYILILPSELVFRIHPEYIKELSGDHGYIPTWSTRAISGPPLRYVHSIDEPEIQKRLLKNWSDLPSLLALDDFLGNEDRTRDNLISINNGRFALVDHADIAGGISRDKDFLNPFLSTRNTLLLDLFEGRVPHAIQSGMLKAAESHSQIFQRAKPKIQYWLNVLLPNDVAHTETLLEYLQVRATTSYTRIKRQEGMLL